jgi:purine-nucleoside phosphorylase
MIYVVVALMAEANVLIDRLNLQKSSSKPFSIYKNQNILILVSGIGSINSSIATSYLLSKHHTPKKIINFGIAGSHSNIKVGELKRVKKIVDLCSNKIYHLHCGEVSISTNPKEIDNPNKIKTDLADMESSGFYLAAKKFIDERKIEIYKIASDHFEPNLVDRIGVELLVKENFEKIYKVLL